MDLDQIPRKVIVLVGALMIIGGLWLGLWSFSRLPFFRAGVLQRTPNNIAHLQNKSASDSPLAKPEQNISPTSPSEQASSMQPNRALEVRETPLTPIAPLYLSLDDSAPAELRKRIDRLAMGGFEIITSTVEANLAPAATIDLTQDDGEAFYKQFFAAAARFDTITSQIEQRDIQQLWATDSDAEDPETASQFTAIGVLSNTLPALNRLLGPPGNTASNTVQTFASVAALSDAVYEQGDLLAFLPFDKLEPRLFVLSIDGQNPVENAFKFVAEEYPYSVTYYLHSNLNRNLNQSVTVEEQRPLLDAVLSQLPNTNRDPTHLTVLAMTGVTAMVRLTASQMDELGNAWPADVIGSELSAADLTHISNEVPFVPGCQTNTSANNLTFCSKPEYMAALDAVGVDVIGLTGNHQNDYGAEDALTSLEIYAEAELPVYGGGKNKEEAFAPLYLNHNGNRLAFLGANSYGPTFAWATDNSPGSAEFDLAIMSATIRSIKEKDLADLVIVDLQYQETYNVSPIVDQRQNFNALIRAGADIVTGVQSHVPQAVEFTDGNIILYGLGNLFFDQMWSQQTRDGLIAKHTFYKGRHISTQLLPTILHDYGQPHWASPAERERILGQVFGASYWE